MRIELMGKQTKNYTKTTKSGGWRALKTLVHVIVALFPVHYLILTVGQLQPQPSELKHNLKVEVEII